MIRDDATPTMCLTMSTCALTRIETFLLNDFDRFWRVQESYKCLRGIRIFCACDDTGSEHGGSLQVIRKRAYEFDPAHGKQFRNLLHTEFDLASDKHSGDKCARGWILGL